MRSSPYLRRSGCAVLTLMLLLSLLMFPSASAQEGSENEKRESYIVDGLFSFTPREFISRFQIHLEESYPDLSITPLEGGEAYNISWGDDSDVMSIVTFYRKNKTAISCNEPDSNDVWCVTLTNVSYTLPLGFLTAGNALEAFAYTADPEMDNRLSSSLTMMRLTSYLNATLEDPPRYWGYAYENNVLYEFGFETMDKYMRQSESAQDVAVAVETVGIYASNWLEEQQQNEDEHGESYVRDGLFTFTPEEFLNQFYVCLRKDYPDCSFGPTEDKGNYMIHLGDDIPMDIYLAFVRKDGSMIEYEERDYDGVWCISLFCVGRLNPMKMLTPEALLTDFLYMLDPHMDAASQLRIQNAKWDAFIAATEENGSESSKYTYENDILYVFTHYFIDDNDDNETPLLVEYNLVYASFAED